jgi:transposase
MTAPKLHTCSCPKCKDEADHPDKELHRKINWFLSQLNYRQRRWYAAIESYQNGSAGCLRASQITGISQATIRRGQKELALTEKQPIFTEPKRTGRPSVEKIYPNIEQVLSDMLTDETAGDPMKPQQWVRSSLHSLSRRLTEQGYKINFCTVRRLLKKLGFSLRVNIKKRKGFGADSPKRDEQFQYIASLKQEFAKQGIPMISVDTKNKELIGDFKRHGKAWRREAEEVLKHDFASLAVCRAVPYGIYDIVKNCGFVYVGTSANTPEFAVDAIARWWKEEGKASYPNTGNILILADGGGSNGWRSRRWKQQVQAKLCDALGLTVTVCHYPTRCSHWNPIERMLFAQISINWAGKPLRSLEMMLGYIRGTTTKTGLTVKAFLQEGIYEKGQQVSKKEMETLALKPHEICPDWNYTISPRTKAST